MEKLDYKTSEFWNNLYKNNDIGWDLSGPSQPFLDILDSLDLQNKKVFIPGCGNGHDVIQIANCGAKVIAVDFAETPLKNIKNHPNFNKNKIELIKSDIFNLNNRFENYFDFVFEYTCYCAIDPVLRENYRDLIHQVLKNGGKFISLFFPILKPEKDGGPPFGVNLIETINFFKEKFKLILKNMDLNSHPKRKGNEVLVIMEKNG